MRLAWSFFIFGLGFGLGPCLLSCGPLLASYATFSCTSFLQGVITYLFFSLSRIAVYLIFSLLTFFLGQLAVDRTLTKGRFFIFFLSGFFLIILGLGISLGRFSQRHFCQRWNRFFYNRSKIGALLLGLVVGILPCAPLLSFFAFNALTSKNWQHNLLNATAFSLGSLFSPLLLLILGGIFLRRNVVDQERLGRLFDFVCGLVIIYLGLRILTRVF